MMSEDTPSPELQGEGNSAGSAFEHDLEAAANGDIEARNRLWSDHYELLHACAKAWLNNHWGQRAARGGLSIGCTHVLHEAFERLHARSAVLAKGRGWFFRCFYTECVRIVVDYIRKSNKHHDRRIGVESRPLAGGIVGADLGVIEAVLSELEKHDPIGAQVAMLKVFESVADESNQGGQRGLRNQEVADQLGYSLSLVEKRWRFAKAYLSAKLSEM